jgi:TonB family protein
MGTVSQKIRTGLVELRTNGECLFATPSFFQRLYLLWTFRNFHSLPRQVLNRHQQQLVDKLRRAALASPEARRERLPIIGVVEIGGSPPNQSVDAGRPMAQAVGELSIASSAPQVVPDPSPDAGAKAIREDSTQQSQDGFVQEVNKVRKRNHRRWAPVAAVAALLLGLVIHFREQRSVQALTMEPPVVQETHPATQQDAPTRKGVTPRPPVQRPIPSTGEEPQLIHVLKPATLKDKTAPSEDADPKVRTPASTAKNVESDSLDRPLFAGGPESGFSYPVARDPNLTGTVSVRAVIRPDGSVSEIKILSGKRALAEAAAKAVRHWRYRPYQSHGRAVEAETRITFNFLGEDAVSIRFSQ